MSDDWLSKLAVRYLGDASRWPEIYDANQAVIEAAAREHPGPPVNGTSDRGHWIFPGTVLTIPGTNCAPMAQTLRQRLEEELLITTGLSRTDARLFLEDLGGCLTSIGLQRALAQIPSARQREAWTNIIERGQFVWDLSRVQAGDVWEGVRVAIVNFAPGGACILFEPTPAGG